MCPSQLAVRGSWMGFKDLSEIYLFHVSHTVCSSKPRREGEILMLPTGGLLDGETKGGEQPLKMSYN